MARRGARPPDKSADHPDDRCDALPTGTRRPELGSLCSRSRACAPAPDRNLMHEKNCAPPNFPSGIRLYRATFTNWSGQVVAGGMWTCAPAAPCDVVTLANWARANGWRLRPRGGGYSWSPLVACSGSPTNTLLVDTTEHLTAVTVHPGSPASVTAQPGVSMDALLGALKTVGYGLTAFPVLGAASLGGVLATAGRGTGVPANGETPLAGHTYGSVANLVTSLTAVVWDGNAACYVLRTFQRSEPQIQALLVNLGRAFVTEVTLRVGADQRLRCQSRFDVSADTLFAPPADASPHSLASHVKRSGRVVCIWFPFTATPWLRVFTPMASKPRRSKEVTAPYAFRFNDIVPRSGSKLLSQIAAGAGSLTPVFTRAQMNAVRAGLTLTRTWDVWGWSSDLLLNVRPTTVRITSACWNVMTSRDRIQQVVSEFHTAYTACLEKYRTRGSFPVNGPLEIRVTGLDQPADCGVPGALSAQLSPLRPRPDHPEWDVAVWFDMTTVPITPDCHAFYADMEQWIRSHYTGSYAAVRPEWPKEWASTSTGAWTDRTAARSAIPDSYRAGQPADDNWDTALATFSALDPAGVFSSDFLDEALL
ncbi:FAD-binding protein [Streptomyces ipomoeae]|uniref:FAD-binding protein n=2 Tax=Streptomyces ipomoeae TaxID=103232 RepID=A0AAE8W5C1_9ACTN|nr:FAD-binding protein [Streptomyces ipomoeae]TQE35842.1 FAD-binding protein [Streptomyces ipomoeae]